MARIATLTEQIVFKSDAEAAEIHRLIAERGNLDNAEVARTAFLAGLPKIAGYKEAKAAYERGERAERRPQRGGARPTRQAA